MSTNATAITAYLQSIGWTENLDQRNEYQHWFDIGTACHGWPLLRVIEAEEELTLHEFEPRTAALLNTTRWSWITPDNADRVLAYINATAAAHLHLN